MTAMSIPKGRKAPHPGDWVEAHAIYGGPGRRGQIVEVIGGPGHERYRVRWDEVHESILFPADGVTLVRHDNGGRRRR